MAHLLGDVLRPKIPAEFLFVQSGFSMCPSVGTGNLHPQLRSGTHLRSSTPQPQFPHLQVGEEVSSACLPGTCRGPCDGTEVNVFAKRPVPGLLLSHVQAILGGASLQQSWGLALAVSPDGHGGSFDPHGGEAPPSFMHTVAGWRCDSCHGPRSLSWGLLGLCADGV